MMMDDAGRRSVGVVGGWLEWLEAVAAVGMVGDGRGGERVVVLWVYVRDVLEVCGEHQSMCGLCDWHDGIETLKATKYLRMNFNAPP
jgi:hypothetical protein